MNRKVYDKAWRTALSYRYRRGQLIVCEDGMTLPLPEDYFQLVETGYLKEELATGYLRKVAEQMLQTHEWGRDFGRTLFVTSEPGGSLYDAMAAAGEHGRALDVDDVDVKDLLEDGRVVIERSALQKMIRGHQSDLASPLAGDGRTAGLHVGERVLG
jgi:large subunit ribosomal protein L4